jgi:hypothetical protein
MSVVEEKVHDETDSVGKRLADKNNANTFATITFEDFL